MLSQFNQEGVITLKSGFWQENTLGNQIEIFSEGHLIEPVRPDIVILSVGEHQHIIQDIREELYGLFFDWHQTRISDVGHYQGSDENFPSVFSRFLSLGCLPVVISGDQKYTYHIYSGYCEAKQTLNIASVDEMPDLEGAEDEVSDKNWLTHILAHSPNFLFNYSLIGFQNYLSNPSLLKSLASMNFDTIRLGQLRNNPEIAEPFLRNTDLFSFDVSSIRKSDCPSSSYSGPNGLYAEEACRLSRYAGISNRLSAAIFCGWNSDAPRQDRTTPKLISQLIWHLADGYYNRIMEGDFEDDNVFTKFNLTHSSVGAGLVFYKSNKSGRWWMNVPTEGQKTEKNIQVPCSYEDYLQAMNGDIPETWWHTFQKL